MPSQDKLIKQGIKYTDKLFDEISKRLEQGVLSSDTLEAFLDKTKEYTAKNPLISSGYDETMLRLILSETNNHKFSRPSQKELVRVTVEQNVGGLIVDVGEDIKDSVKDIVKDGYNNNLPQDKIAENISNRVGVIKNKRARAIARTEIARTATVSDYIINKERGATHWYVECRNTACPICKEAWLKHWSKSNDESFKPNETTAGGKGWVGDKVYSMEDTSMLPPVHPNCRCVVYFVNENDGKPTTSQEPTPEQVKANLNPSERAKYANYKRTIASHEEWLRNNPNAPAEQIANRKKRLAATRAKFEELRKKALGGKTNGNTGKPKPKPKPKTEEEQTKITREQLENGLTPQQLKEYDDVSKRIDKIKKWLKDDPLKRGFTQSDIDSQKAFLQRSKQRLEELKKIALTPKPIPNSELPNLTTKQLRDNLTPEQIKYYNLKLKEIEKLRKWLKENPTDAHAPARRDILEIHIKDLDNLKKMVLDPKPKEEPRLTKSKEKEKPKQPESKLKFEELKSPEDVAEYFGFEYSFGDFPKPDKQYETLTGNDGRRYRVGKCENKGKFHKFYDKEHDCTIYVAQSITKPSKAKDSKGKIYIDITNSGKGVRNLKDVVQMYWDAPRVLKESNTSITWTNRRAKSLYAYNKLLDKKWERNLKTNPDFEKHITHGKQPNWIDMYVNCIEDDLAMGHSMQRTLYHEMAHGLDNILSESWDTRGRFSDNHDEGGYVTFIHTLPIFNKEKTKRIGTTSEDIVDGMSSEYGQRHWRKTLSCSEDFADAVSMVAFKNIEDKTGAVILPPNWSWSNKLSRVTYEEWIKEYNHKFKFLEEVLNI